jgi:signal transduction histidine kinase
MSERVTRWLIAGAGVSFGLVVCSLVLTSAHDDAPTPVLFLLVVIGWLFIGGGLAARWWRPDSRFWVLMTAVGFAWLSAGLSEANNAWVFTLGLAIGSIWIALLIYATLAFPDGRLESRLARVTVGATFVAVAVGTSELLWGTTADLGNCSGDSCPRNVLLISRMPGLVSAIDLTVVVLGFAIAVTMLTVLVRRWRAASKPLRRTLAPMFWTAGAFVSIFVVLAAFDAAFDLSQGIIYALLLTAFAAVPLAFIGGLLRGRLPQAAVARLVVELGDVPTSGGVRDALARALRDPSLTLAYWIPDRAAYVDAAGHPVAPDATPGRTATVVHHAGERIAVLVHDASLDDNPTLIEAAAAAAGMALANERLQAELRAHLEELRASRARIVQAGDAERRRLERNLHDGAQQRLVALSLEIRLARAKLRTDPDGADRVLENAGAELTSALEELRELARGIHPAVLDRGLGPALRSLANRERLPVELHYETAERFPGSVEAAAYYVVAEALTNVAKYADATAARVEVARRDGRAVVTVSDDGVGGADPGRGSGLRGLRDRVEALDGTLRVSSPPGGGTEVVAEIPLGAGSG